MSIKERVKEEALFWGVWVPVCVIGAATLYWLLTRKESGEAHGR